MKNTTEQQLISLITAVNRLCTTEPSNESHPLFLADFELLKAAKIYVNSNVERFLKADARYEYLRKLNPREYASLFNEHIKSDKRFDDMVDERLNQQTCLTS